MLAAGSQSRKAEYGAVIYLRGIEQKQLDDAERRCREYAGRFGWPVLESIRDTSASATPGQLIAKVTLGRPALSGQLYLCYFMLRAAGSGTRRGPLAESGSRVPSGDASDYSGSRCTALYPPVLSSASGRRSGAPARPSQRR
jgi:hypothetical protein